MSDSRSSVPPSPDRIVGVGVINDSGTATNLFQPGPNGTFTLAATWVQQGHTLGHRPGRADVERLDPTACIGMPSGPR